MNELQKLNRKYSGSKKNYKINLGSLDVQRQQKSLTFYIIQENNVLN